MLGCQIHFCAKIYVQMVLIFCLSITSYDFLSGGLIPGGAVLVFILELIEVKGDYV